MYKVLYVDDEPGLLDLGRIYLEATGDFSVITSTGALQALPGISTGGYDAIISDYQMPEIDGIAFLKAVRDQHGDLPFILFTGRGREEVVINAINNGADFYIQKGGDPMAQFAELAHKVRQAVARKRAQDELRAAYEQIAAAEEELRGQYDELARNERQIRASEERYRRLTGKIPIPVCVADDQDRVTYINDRFTEVFGYMQEDIPTLKEWWELAYPDGQYRREVIAAWSGAIQDALENGHDIPSLVYRVTCRDGTVRQVEIGGIPLESSFLATFIDVTEKVRAEQELRKSEESYRGLFNTVRQAIYIQDADWKFIDVNDGAVAMYGYSRGEFIGKTPEFLSAPGKNDLAATVELMKKAFAGEPQQFIFWARKKNGEVFRKDVRVYKGTYFGKDVLIAIGTDITGNW